MNGCENRRMPSKFIFLPAVFILVPLIEIAYHNFVESRIPQRQDYKTASSIIKSRFMKDDLVVINPWWATEGWLYLGDFMTVEKMAREDDRGYGRIWEVAWKGRIVENYKKEGKLEEEWDAGRLVVRLWKFPSAPENLYDFVAKVESASVEMTDSDRRVEKTCSFRKNPPAGIGSVNIVQTGKFICNPSLPWNTVHREVIADLDNKPRLCIWAHPITNKRVKITFNDVPSGAFLEGHMGLKYEADREGTGKPPVFLDIFASEILVGSAMHEEGKGWVPYRFAMPHGWNGGKVTFEVHTPFDGMQHFCFTAKLRDK